MLINKEISNLESMQIFCFPLACTLPHKPSGDNEVDQGKQNDLWLSQDLNEG